MTPDEHIGGACVVPTASFSPRKELPTPGPRPTDVLPGVLLLVPVFCCGRGVVVARQVRGADIRQVGIQMASAGSIPDGHNKAQGICRTPGDTKGLHGPRGRKHPADWNGSAPVKDRRCRGPGSKDRTMRKRVMQGPVGTTGANLTQSLKGQHPINAVTGIVEQPNTAGITQPLLWQSVAERLGETE